MEDPVPQKLQTRVTDSNVLAPGPGLCPDVGTD